MYAERKIYHTSQSNVAFHRSIVYIIQDFDILIDNRRHSMHQSIT